ncbi:hypothetical protein VTO42DRAFT_7912 [Malbranchea cinnamomea]
MPRATRSLARFHIDLAGGGMTLGSKDDNPPSREETRYFMLITDDATRFRWENPDPVKDNAYCKNKGLYGNQLHLTALNRMVSPSEESVIPYNYGTDENHVTGCKPA